ncbi:DUF6114 domain-containing protein [Streptosporangium sp. NPDC087985]|uniref:DUF6114 domain-containing protein n=1 Tax=Streptosporangium sp. NPDC087985 TaxID=3366196 RepID=UPI0037FFD773
MAEHGNHGRRRSLARGFLRWRRSRPFWGGLWVILGGTVLLLAPLASLPLIVQQGVAGISGSLIGLLLVAVGVLGWLQPKQRVFLGVVAMLLSLASFVTSNFGGFGLGMILGIVGGALLFAWLPGEVLRTDLRRQERDRAAGAGRDRDDGLAAGTGRLLAFTALPLAVVVAVYGGSVPADRLWSRLGADDEPSRNERGAPDDSRPHAISDPRQPDPRPSSAYPPGRSERADAAVTITSAQDFLRAVRDHRTAGARERAPVIRTQDDGDLRLIAGTAQSGLSAGTFTMSGARFGGVVDRPTANGSRRYLKLLMDEVRISKGKHRFRHPGGTTWQDLPSMTMSGDVILYVTRMQARILGIKLTFTPALPPPLLPPRLTVTDLDVSDPLVQAKRVGIKDFGQRSPEN